MVLSASNCVARSRRTRRNAWYAALLAAASLFIVAGGCTHPPAPPRQTASPPTLQAQVTANPTNTNLRVALANELAGAGETFAAIEQLEAARALGADDLKLLRDLAQRYDSVGEPEAAAATLTSGGASAELALPLANACLQLGDFRRSADALRPLLKNRAALAPHTLQTTVRAILLAGDAETAAHLIPRAKADAEWQALSGLQLLLVGQPRRAVDAFRQALALNPRDTWNGYLLGRAYLACGDLQRALEAWLPTVQGPDAPPLALVATARLLAESGRLDQADALLDHVQGEDRKLPGYWQSAAIIAQQRHHPAIAQISLGYAAYNLGDPWQAEMLWRRTLPLASEDEARQIYAALSNSAARRQDAQAALNYAAAAAKRWPQDQACLRQYAEMLLAQSQVREALAVALRFQKAASSERQAQAAELLARIALDAGKPDLLQQSVQLARTLAPTDPIPLLRMAEWQGQQGHDGANLERTLALYREAQRIAPSNAEATARAGLILADLKRTDEAITTLLHALTLNSRILDGAPNALLTQLYQRQGKTFEAQFEAQRYQQVRALKETWPSLLKALRQQSPAPRSEDWKALGEMALLRHEDWIGLCGFTRRVRLTPHDPEAWRDIAAAQKRFGWFDDALASMRRAHLLASASGNRAQR